MSEHEILSLLTYSETELNAKGESFANMYAHLHEGRCISTTLQCTVKLTLERKKKQRNIRIQLFLTYGKEFVVFLVVMENSVWPGTLK